MLYILIIVVLTIADQITKYIMVQVSGGEIGYSIPVIRNFLHFTYVENHGGIFGLFQGKINVFTAVSVILIIYVIMTEYKNFKNYTKWTKIGISVIAAGAEEDEEDDGLEGNALAIISATLASVTPPSVEETIDS